MKPILFGFVLVAGLLPDAGGECVGFSLEHYRQHADLVFSGTIREVKQLDPGRTVVSLEVDRVWKGKVGQRIVLHQAIESIDAYRFLGDEGGARYLVFAKQLDARQREMFGLEKGEEGFGTPLCGGGTRRLVADDSVLRQLGRGRRPW